MSDIDFGDLLKIISNGGKAIVGTYDSVNDKAEKLNMDCHLSKFLNSLRGKDFGNDNKTQKHQVFVLDAALQSKELVNKLDPYSIYVVDKNMLDQYYNPWNFTNFYNFMLRRDGLMVSLTNEMALRRFMNLDKFFRGIQSDDNKDFVGPEEMYANLTHQARVLFVISNDKQRKDIANQIA